MLNATDVVMLGLSSIMWFEVVVNGVNEHTATVWRQCMTMSMPVSGHLVSVN